MGKSVLTTLCYIERDQEYLMLHRVSKKHDINKDKWIGVGGHFEEGESPEECLLREVYEETGLTLTSWRFRGIVTFCSEGTQTEYMCLYTASAFEGEITACNEGVLEWVRKDQLTDLNLWDGDRLFLELLQKEAPFFSLKLCYDRSGKWRQAILDGKELELFDLVDENGEPTGQVKERSMVHEKGDRHRTAHVWVARRKMDGTVEVLLQKRSPKKDAYPGYYDISAAGHAHAGDELKEAATRELQEELGICAEPGELQLVGMRKGYRESEFWGKPFRDREVSAVYVYEQPVCVEKLTLQKSEVEEVSFVELEKLIGQVREQSILSCIDLEELLMLKKALVTQD